MLSLGLFTLAILALQLTSWSTCLTDESIEDKPEQINSWYLAAECYGCMVYTRMKIATYKIARVNAPLEVKTSNQWNDGLVNKNTV